MMESPYPTSKGKERASTRHATELLDLPGEILSQIAAYLPLNEVIAFLSLHSALHALAHSHLTPLRAVIAGLLRAGPPYPPALAVLPSLHHLVPQGAGDDGGRLFLDVLVRAPPRWILERLEVGRWRDGVWKEAFERRFLPSWRRYKKAEDSWRAAFLRTLAMVEHRSVGCGHHESWTRFITLRKNGSGMINRIYTRTFDPYEIFDEFKHQANFEDSPTEVRVLVHLQDVRVIALGVLSQTPSYATNPNAHLALHPPLLRHLSMARKCSGRARRREPSPESRPTAISSSAIETVVELSPDVSDLSDPVAPEGDGHGEPPEHPLARTLSASSSTRSSRPNSPTTALVSAFGNWVVRRRMSSDNAGEDTSNHPLTPFQSAESTRRRSWSMSLPRLQRAQSVPAAMPLLPPPPPSGPPVPLVSPPPTVSGSPTLVPTASPFSPMAPPIPLMPTLPEDRIITPRSDSPASPPKRHNLPYPPLTRPTPAYTHALYPNFTPSDESNGDALALGSGDPELREPSFREPFAVVRDYRADYPEAEDSSQSGIWVSSDEYWPADGMRMTEWDRHTASRRRWVGPMLIMAQLFPATRREAVPFRAQRSSAVEGAHPDLGPPGLYASLGWEDIQALLPWVVLRDTGGWDHEPRRSGLGF